MAKKKKPAIRFKGFMEEWEEQRFSNLVLIERGASPRPIDDYITNESGGLNWIKIGDAPAQGNYISKTAEKIKLSGLSKTRQVQPGDLILSNSMSFGKPYIMAVNGCIHDGWLLIRNTQNNFNLKFLCYLLGTTQMLKQYKALAAGSTVNNLNKELVGNTIVTYPKGNEQIKLGAFFEVFDHLITLHQRKYEKLQNIKKSMLEKMFPQNGKNIPEIRFKGFMENWGQHKLGELCNIYDGTHQTPAYKNSGIMFLSVENIRTLKSEKYISKEDFEKNFSVFPEMGDILMTRIGDIGTANVVESNEPKAYYVSLALLKKKKLDPYFLKESISSDTVKKEIWQRTLHIAFPKKINKNEITQVIVIYPLNQDEQKEIGNFFYNLDHLINLHKRKLEKLQNIKKSCLEKMFV